jgi:hypothetical protein
MASQRAEIIHHEAVATADRGSTVERAVPDRKRALPSTVASPMKLAAAPPVAPAVTASQSDLPKLEFR